MCISPEDGRFLVPSPIKIGNRGMRFELPAGEYPGRVEWLTVTVQGHQKTQLAKAILILDRKQIEELGLDPGTLVELGCDVLPSLKTGLIQFSQS